MSEQLFSPSWYRVANLHARVKEQAEIRRQEYRGEVWYVLYDQITAKSLRLTPSAYTLLGLLDGEKTVEEAWLQAAEILGDQLPTQDEVIQLLTTLHQSDVLSSEQLPDLHEMHERYQSRLRSDRLKRFINPMALKFKLFDPERLLLVLQPLARVLFSRLALVVWLLAVISGLVAVGTHWQSFTEGMADRILSFDNLLVMLVVFPVIKTFHELGHALAVKKWGGEVHDIGIMFLVFMPVPYVDASSSWSFRDKYHRMIVGAAGMLVEVFLASLAMLLWVLLEPGLLRSLVYNAVFIAGVSTLLFNINPLLRFDGYYIFMDWLEIPNLGARANKYFIHLCKQHLFGMPEGDVDWGNKAERKWLVFYAVASFIYRLLLSITIAIFVSGKFFIVGVLLAAWALAMTLALPLLKLIKYLWSSPELRRFRPRALRVSGLIVAGLFSLVFLIPLPFFTVSEGIVWVPEEDHLRARIDGFVEKVYVPSGKKVKQGELLIKLIDRELTNRKQVLQHQLTAMEARYRIQRTEDQLEAGVIRDEIESIQKELDDIIGKLSDMVLKAPVGGVFVLPRESDLPGRFFKKGQLVGYVIHAGQTTIRVAVEQQNVGLVRNMMETVEVLFSSELFKSYAASIIREVPGATRNLPSPALTTQGGGVLANDPNSKDGASSFQQVFLFDLDVPDIQDSKWLGERVHVRFDHGYAPLWEQWYRSIRQLFLRISDF